MYALARDAGLIVRGGIQCAFGYQRADDVQREKVVEIAQKYLDLGVDELALADSAGFGNPQTIRSMIESIGALAGDTPLVLHLHDTRGMGLANVLAAWVVVLLLMAQVVISLPKIQYICWRRWASKPAWTWVQWPKYHGNSRRN